VKRADEDFDFEYNDQMDKYAQASRDPTTFSIVSLHEADGDQEFWGTKSVGERLLAVELTRQVIYGYQPASGRLQRVFEVAELKTR
jgi:hypothetical protein